MPDSDRRPAGTGLSRYGCLTGLEGAEMGPLPAALIASTLKVYRRPGVRPVMIVNGIPLVDGVISPWHPGQAGEAMMR